MSYLERDFMRGLKRSLYLGAVSLIVLASVQVSNSAGAKREGPNFYRLIINGTAGAKVRMLLIHRPKKTGLFERRDEVVTVPATIEFKGESFQVWFETLPDGGSGKDGDTIDAGFSKNGDRNGGGVGITVKKQNHSVGSFGDL